MLRSQALRVSVLCPHFGRPVTATRNGMTEKLVDCDSKSECVSLTSDEGGVSITVYPAGCPVFRRPA